MLNASKKQKIHTEKTAEPQRNYLRATTSDAEDGDCGSPKTAKRNRLISKKQEPT